MLLPVSVWILTSVVLAVGIAVVVFWSQRQQRAVSEISEQIRRLTAESGAAGRIGLEGKSESLERLGTAVNQLLENLEERGASLEGRERLFKRLVETVHHAVLVHRQRILYANSRFLALLGMTAKDVVGRPLGDFVAPEYVELVSQNLRRRLAGEPAAERYEVELQGARGELTRVELSSTLIDNDGESALLLTALEMMPEASGAGQGGRPRAVATLDAMGESVITVDAEGRID